MLTALAPFASQYLVCPIAQIIANVDERLTESQLSTWTGPLSDHQA